MYSLAVISRPPPSERTMKKIALEERFLAPDYETDLDLPRDVDLIEC
jgi:hypothetical protein